MSFTDEQKAALSAPLSSGHVSQRTQAGRQLSYIEAWHAIAEANRIFGFDAWDRETVELRQLGEPREVDGKWRVSYMARVRITVRTIRNTNDLAPSYSDDTVTRQGSGYGSGIDRDVGQAHESALKEAESDAMKRALMTFGNPFGLALYDKTQSNVVHDEPEARPAPSLAPQNGIKRLSSARAKEIGLDDKLKDQINACHTRTELATWDRDFDKHTGEAPLSWLDSIRNHVILRGEEIDAEAAGAGMDDAFKNTVGPSVSQGAARAQQAAGVPA